MMKFKTEEMKSEREKKVRAYISIMFGLVKRVSETTTAYNVDNTSDEKPGISGISDWDEYWVHYTEENLTGQKCASCGCSLDASNRVGAHIRLDGEKDNTRDAWIALYCKSCNNSREEQRVRKGSLIVKTKMVCEHPNVPTIEDKIKRILRK